MYLGVRSGNLCGYASRWFGMKSFACRMQVSPDDFPVTRKNMPPLQRYLEKKKKKMNMHQFQNYILAFSVGFLIGFIVGKPILAIIGLVILALLTALAFARSNGEVIFCISLVTFGVFLGSLLGSMIPFWSLPFLL